MAKGKYQRWLEPEGLTLLEDWARNGLTDEQIAKNMGISVASLYNWKRKHLEILEALKKGKDVVDAQVESALLRRALGYEHTVDRIDELIRQLVAQLDELVTLRQEIGAVIDAVPDTRLRELLRLRYIDGLTFDGLAIAMGHYDLRWVYRLHRRALEALTIESHH